MKRKEIINAFAKALRSASFTKTEVLHATLHGEGGGEIVTVDELTEDDFKAIKNWFADDITIYRNINGGAIAIEVDSDLLEAGLYDIVC